MPTCKSFLFHTVLMVHTIAFLTANPIYFCFRFTNITTYYIIFPLTYPADIWINCYSVALSPLLSSFAIPLVSKILLAITFYKPNFLFWNFLPLFILSPFEWHWFSFNNSINVSFKEIFIDSAECKFHVALSGSLFKTSFWLRGYRPQQQNAEIKLDKTIWLTSISNFLRSQQNISLGIFLVAIFSKFRAMNVSLDRILTRQVLGSN